MLLKTLIPSMFHRRLLLLLALLALGFAPLVGQITRLAVVKGADLRQQAESRLTRSRQTPTVRGSILDRKDRVLAQDRPSYDIAVDFRVIDGSWAREEGRKAAARSMGTAWGGLSRDARSHVVEQFEPVFVAHLDRAWERLSEATGVPLEEIHAARERVISRVSQRQQSVFEGRMREEQEAASKTGRPLTQDELRAMERRSEAPISEKRQAHVVIPRVGDDIGFACFVLASEEAELPMPAAEDRLGESRQVASQLVEVVPGLEVRDSSERDYPSEYMRVRVDRSTFPPPLASEEPIEIEVGGVAGHILGTLRETVYQSAKGDPSAGTIDVVGDAERRADYLADHPDWRSRALEGSSTERPIDRGAYRDGDRIGATGLENSQEHLLRGLRGVQSSRVDTGKRVFVSPVRGRDVRLTVDASLQARVQAAMDPRLGLARVQSWHKQQSPTQKEGDPLNGAAVVLDIDTGDILAMVSTPTYTRREFKEEYARLRDDILGAPLLNRAVGKYYTPGSIVKPVMLVEAVKHGDYSLDQRIACTGHLFERVTNRYQCWIYKQFSSTHNATLGHDLSAEEGIMVSCNIFFFTLGRRMGPEAVIAGYEEFGVGRTFGLGVGGEAPGAIGFKRTAKNYGMEPGDAIQVGIGQGPVTWTPLHAANAYATLARGGLWVEPRIIKGETRAEPRDLGLDSSAVAAAIRGLERSVGEPDGTGHHISIEGYGKVPIFNAPGVQVWGKTGTADAPKVLGDDPDGPNGPLRREILEDGDHSWFVVMVGHGRPQYVISVVIDYGGSGGKVSGPITNQIIHALMAEGYL